MKKLLPNSTTYFTFFLWFILLTLGFAFFTSCSGLENEKAIRWKFENFDKLTYTFTQQTQVSPTAGLLSLFKITNTARGKLIITTNQDGKADVYLKDLNMGEMGDLLTYNLKKEDGKLPEVFIKGLKSNGVVEGEISEVMQLFYTGLFPIPSKDLKIGESVKIPAQMTMNIFGSKSIDERFPNAYIRIYY